MESLHTNTIVPIYTENKSGQTYIGETCIDILRNNNSSKVSSSINGYEVDNYNFPFQLPQYNQISFEGKPILKLNESNLEHTNFISNFYSQIHDDVSNVSAFENIYDYYVRFRNLYINTNETFSIPIGSRYLTNKSNAVSIKVLQKIKQLSTTAKLKASDLKHKLSSIKFERKQKLNNELEKEIIRVESKFKIKIKQLTIDEVNYIFDLVSELPFENSAVELGLNNSFKLTLVFPNDRILMLSKSFDTSEEICMKDDILYSFFINRILVASDVTNIQTYIKRFKGYISN